MARRTIYLPDPVEQLIRQQALEGESFSAAVVRLVEAGSRAAGTRRRPRYVATGDGPDELGARAEQYLRDLVTAR
jgi:hypothetical protein